MREFLNIINQINEKKSYFKFAVGSEDRSKIDQHIRDWVAKLVKKGEKNISQEKISKDIKNFTNIYAFGTDNVSQLTNKVNSDYIKNQYYGELAISLGLESWLTPDGVHVSATKDDRGIFKPYKYEDQTAARKQNELGLLDKKAWEKEYDTTIKKWNDPKSKEFKLPQVNNPKAQPPEMNDQPENLKPDQDWKKSQEKYSDPGAIGKLDPKFLRVMQDYVAKQKAKNPEIKVSELDPPPQATTTDQRKIWYKYRLGYRKVKWRGKTVTAPNETNYEEWLKRGETLLKNLEFIKSRIENQKNENIVEVNQYNFKDAFASLQDKWENYKIIVQASFEVLPTDVQDKFKKQFDKFVAIKKTATVDKDRDLLQNPESRVETFNSYIKNFNGIAKDIEKFDKEKDTVRLWDSLKKSFDTTNQNLAFAYKNLVKSHDEKKKYELTDPREVKIRKELATLLNLRKGKVAAIKKMLYSKHPERDESDLKKLSTPEELISQFVDIVNKYPKLKDAFKIDTNYYDPIEKYYSALFNESKTFIKEYGFDDKVPKEKDTVKTAKEIPSREDVRELKKIGAQLQGILKNSQKKLKRLFRQKAEAVVKLTNNIDKAVGYVEQNISQKQSANDRAGQIRDIKPDPESKIPIGNQVYNQYLRYKKIRSQVNPKPKQNDIEYEAKKLQQLIDKEEFQNLSDNEVIQYKSGLGIKDTTKKALEDKVLGILHDKRSSSDSFTIPTAHDKNSEKYRQGNTVIAINTSNWQYWLNQLEQIITHHRKTKTENTFRSLIDTISLLEAPPEELLTKMRGARNSANPTPEKSVAKKSQNLINKELELENAPKIINAFKDFFKTKPGGTPSLSNEQLANLESKVSQLEHDYNTIKYTLPEKSSYGAFTPFVRRFLTNPTLENLVKEGKAVANVDFDKWFQVGGREKQNWFFSIIAYHMELPGIIHPIEFQEEGRIKISLPPSVPANGLSDPTEWHNASLYKGKFIYKNRELTREDSKIATQQNYKGLLSPELVEFYQPKETDEKIVNSIAAEFMKLVLDSWPHGAISTASTDPNYGAEKAIQSKIKAMRSNTVKFFDFTGLDPKAFYLAIAKNGLDYEFRRWATREDLIKADKWITQKVKEYYPDPGDNKERSIIVAKLFAKINELFQQAAKTYANQPAQTGNKQADVPVKSVPQDWIQTAKRRLGTIHPKFYAKTSDQNPAYILIWARDPRAKDAKGNAILKKIYIGQMRATDYEKNWKTTIPMENPKIEPPKESTKSYKKDNEDKVMNEASMNISMNGNTSQEVQELMALLRNAGLPDSKPVTDLDISQPMAVSMPDPTEKPCGCGAMHGIDTPCGESVDEEWDNAPNEEYQDEDYMLQDLSGGINRKKEKQAIRVKDPAIAYESKLKNELKSNLEEMYKRLAENDPFAELDKAIASDDMEGDLERQEKLARLKMAKKKNRAKMEATPNSLMQQMKKKTGTGMGGKQHSQYQQFANKTPMQLGPGKAPVTKGIAGALAQGPKTAAAPKTVSAPAQGINPVTASLAAKAFPGFINKGGTVQQVVDFWINKGVPHNELADFFRAKIQKQKAQ